MTKSLRVIVSGRVQGVWFRAWTEREAKALGLDGWVRNRRDGSVEAVICGADDAVAAMLKALAEGPELAHVDAVEQHPYEEAVAPGFEVRVTG
jgi:acylphosphatase